MHRCVRHAKPWQWGMHALVHIQGGNCTRTPIELSGRLVPATHPPGRGRPGFGSTSRTVKDIPELPRLILAEDAGRDGHALRPRGPGQGHGVADARLGNSWGRLAYKRLRPHAGASPGRYACWGRLCAGPWRMGAEPRGLRVPVRRRRLADTGSCAARCAVPRAGPGNTAVGTEVAWQNEATLFPERANALLGVAARLAAGAGER
jgi:hypothetical protein